MVASDGGVAARGRWDISFFMAQTRLASSGQVHHVRQREDIGFTWKWDHESIDVTRVTLHFHSTPNGGDKTHTSARRVLEELGSEENKGRTHGRLDFLSEEAPRTRQGTIKPAFRPASM